MLTASEPAPNSPRKTPKPANWLGVTDGLASARQAIEQGKLPYAERILREVLEFAPAEAEAWQWLGKVLQARDRAEEAKACMDRAASLQHRASREDSKPVA
ncbi:MAG: tetratricopeptide repeat protein, partial [Mariprofundaceae bacterium]